MKKKSLHAGTILLQAFVFGAISIVIVGALVSWAGTNIRASRVGAYREQALQISEAGIDYYRWHLAHAQADYTDGVATTTTGPFIHTFTDKDGVPIGSYSLYITPPLSGSTLVTIVSEGRVNTDPSIVRKIKVQLGMPSFAKYAMVTNSQVFYGSGDEVFGPIHSNVGVGFQNGAPQPIAHNLVTSAAASFNGNFGVYTTVPAADNGPGGAVPNRSDVFAGGRQFPVPVIDFTGLTSNLSAIKAGAIASGFYRGASGGNGYKVVLKVNDTFDLYKVNSLLPAPGGCTNAVPETGWGIWSINTAGGSTTLLGNYAFPANGLLFFEDHVWVEGQINTARITIGAGTFPVNSATYKNIIVNNNLVYTNFDGTDAIGLIAQGNFLVGLNSADNLTIDGALVAQNGATIRYYYASNKCGTGLRNTLTTYGMFASNGQGYFYNGNNGYISQPATYDANFYYGPPPSFPLTSSQYQIVSWQEI